MKDYVKNYHVPKKEPKYEDRHIVVPLPSKKLNKNKKENKDNKENKEIKENNDLNNTETSIIQNIEEIRKLSNLHYHQSERHSLDLKFFFQCLLMFQRFHRTQS